MSQPLFALPKLEFEDFGASHKAELLGMRFEVYETDAGNWNAVLSTYHSERLATEVDFDDAIAAARKKFAELMGEKFPMVNSAYLARAAHLHDCTIGPRDDRCTCGLEALQIAAGIRDADFKPASHVHSYEIRGEMAFDVRGDERPETLSAEAIRMALIAHIAHLSDEELLEPLRVFHSSKLKVA